MTSQTLKKYYIKTLCLINTVFILFASIVLIINRTKNENNEDVLFSFMYLLLTSVAETITVMPYVCTMINRNHIRIHTGTKRLLVFVEFVNLVWLINQTILSIDCIHEYNEICKIINVMVYMYWCKYIHFIVLMIIIFLRTEDTQETYEVEWRRMDSEEINMLTTINCNEEMTKESCSICLDDYVMEDKITVLPCGHKYHYNCISNWLKRNAVCPLCKREITEA